MDLEKNIRIAAEVYFHNNIEESTLPDTDCFIEMFITGAKSQAAKDFWYNEFKRQRIQSDSGQDQSLRNKPMKPSECFHGKSTKCAIIGVGSQMIIPEPIQSIVPIADIIPEQIISKQELLLMHDKAIERSITEETYKESRAWDIKKEKKVSHKRTNKRR